MNHKSYYQCLVTNPPAVIYDLFISFKIAK